MKHITFFIVAVLTLSILSCRQSAEKSNTPLPLSEAEKMAYLEQGKDIAGATFATLSAKLQAAVKEGGVANAVEYCSLQAYPLVDSLSKAHQVQIRRTTLKERNPDNAPTTVEKEILQAYAAAVAAGEKPLPMVKPLEDQSVAFYAPIQVSALCLQCHGKIGETLKTEDYALIRQHYPEDKATGYAEGDLRGMWSIRFYPNSK